jgi:hypothetical protein
MDPTLPAIVISMIASHLMRLADKGAERAEDDLLDRLYEVVKSRLLKSDPGRAALTGIQVQPNDPERQAGATSVLAEEIGRDPAWGDQLSQMLNAIRHQDNSTTASAASRGRGTSIASTGNVELTGSYVGVGRVDQRRSMKISSGGWLLILTAAFFLTGTTIFGATKLIMPVVEGPASTRAMNGGDAGGTDTEPAGGNPVDITYEGFNYQVAILKYERSVTGAGGASAEPGTHFLAVTVQLTNLQNDRPASAVKPVTYLATSPNHGKIVPDPYGGGPELSSCDIGDVHNMVAGASETGIPAGWCLVDLESYDYSFDQIDPFGSVVTVMYSSLPVPDDVDISVFQVFAMTDADTIYTKKYVEAPKPR